MKKIFILLVSFIITFPVSVYAISAQSAIVIDSSSGRILYSHNAENKLGMASTTKIVTAITALENGDINSTVTVSSKAYGVEGSSMYLGLNEKLTLENLLYGLMLVSGNDAATAVAEHISGSVDKFAKLMNETALKAGAENSNFTNPHGLSDKNHYTTAHDLAKITAYAIKNPKFKEIVSTYKKSIPWQDHEYNRHLVNHNKFLNMYDGCIGVKTGFTKATGRCLVTAVEKSGMTLICVTLNAPDDWNDHKALYDRIFDEYSPKTLKTANDVITSVQIKNSTTDKINLITPNNITVPLKENERDKIKIHIYPFEDLWAPVKKGDILGTLVVEINEDTLYKYPLIAETTADTKKITFNSSSNSFPHYLKKTFYYWVTCFK